MVRLAALLTRTRIVAAVVRLVRFRETARHATAAVAAVTVKAAAVVPAGVCQATDAAPIGTHSNSAEAPSAAAVREETSSWSAGGEFAPG